MDLAPLSPIDAHHIYLDHSHLLNTPSEVICELVRLSCTFIIRVDSKASLTAAVIMLGSIKAPTAVPMLVMTMIIDIWLFAALFSGCVRIEDF